MKKSSGIIIAIFFFVRYASVFAQTNHWNLIATIPEVNLHSIQLTFTDSLRGYLFGWKPLQSAYPTYKDAVFYRTVDGGNTWQNIDLRIVLGADTLYAPDDFSLQLFAGSPNSCFISNAAIGKFASSQDLLTIYGSKNNGASWIPVRVANATKRSDYLIEAALNDHEITAMRINSYIGGAPYSGQFEVSETNGAIFDDIRWDSTLLSNILVGKIQHIKKVNTHNFDYFDDFTWIITVSDTANSENIDLAKPYSLVTLLGKDLDSDADPGTYWEAYRNTIPDFPSYIEANYFDIHCVRGSESVYLFSRYDGTLQYPFYGINYLYSSDQGRTWNADSSFVIQGGTFRRAYTASAAGEVWLSLIPTYSNISINTPATWIAHSTNSGKNWDIDSTSLLINEKEYYDGEAVTFSDKNHGWLFAQSTNGNNSAIFRYTGSEDGVKTTAGTTNARIFPNPADKEITIISSNGIPILNIDIYDILGRKWTCQYEIKSDIPSASINTNQLPPGSYLAQIRNTSGMNLIPFIVRH